MYKIKKELRKKITKKIEEIFKTSLTIVEDTLAAESKSFLPRNSERYFVPATGKAKGAITVNIV